MKPGPKAILYQNALFRTTELAWLKVAPLPPWRQAVRWSLIASGFLFFYLVASAKGSYSNIEGFLGLLAWHVGFCTHSQVRLGSSGDLQESYDNRGGGGSQVTFRQWYSALSETENECKIEGPRYQYWFNLQRIAWAGPCWLVDWYPLVLPPVFLFYRWLILKDFELGDTLILNKVSFLTFVESTGTVQLMCWLVSLLGLVAFFTSLSPGVEVRASGGVGDQFAMTDAERSRLFERLSGSLEVAAPARPAAPVQAVPAPTPAPPPPAPAVETPEPVAPAP